VVNERILTAVNLGFLDRRRYLSFKQLLIYPLEAVWTPFQTHYFSENLVWSGIGPGTSASLVRNSDSLTEAVNKYKYFYIRIACYFWGLGIHITLRQLVHRKKGLIKMRANKTPKVGGLGQKVICGAIQEEQEEFLGISDRVHSSRIMPAV
jgi:hypothetical protein